jgi:hypothetical protein
MIGLAIQILWLLLGVIVLVAIVWFALYALKMFVPVPTRIEQLVWIVLLILILIGVLSLLAGGGAGLTGPHFLR